MKQEKSTVYKKNPDFVARRIEDEVILVPIKKDAADFEAIYNLDNDTSVKIWELIDGNNSLDEIKKRISNEFSVSPEKLNTDIDQFIKDLEKIKAICRF